jgi:putative toxin-antitoxin system antitoxin component (TIGR02293 family)
MAEKVYTGSMATHLATPIPALLPPPPTHAGSSGLRSLGLERMETPAILGLLRNGLTWAQLVDFQRDAGFSGQEMAAFLDLPERTFARRRSTGRFSSGESEKLLRLMEIHQSALHLMDGDAAAVHAWLTEPVRGLGNARPIDYAQSDYGAREVRNLLGRLEHGVFS